tara:strand:- start:589 stop:840 length:252 start_codon:yes stop_codon:yes gene_type:complete
MNINPNFDNQEECPPADEVVAHGMNFLFEKVIEPMKDKLDPEDLALISLIGMSFKIVGEQATAYEKLQEGFDSDSNGTDFNRN